MTRTMHDSVIVSGCSGCSGRNWHGVRLGSADIAAT